MSGALNCIRTIRVVKAPVHISLLPRSPPPTACTNARKQNDVKRVPYYTIGPERLHVLGS